MDKFNLTVLLMFVALSPFILRCVPKELEPTIIQTKQNEVKKNTKKSSTKPAAKKKDVDKYTKLKEDIDVSPLKAQAALKILVDKKISPDELREVLSKLYKSYRAKKGYKYHDRLTNIYIHAYHDKDIYKSSAASWVGMLSWTKGKEKPDISINEVMLKAINEPEKKKSNMSLAKRKEIFKSLVACEDKGFNESMEKYPEDFKKSAEYARKVQKECDIKVYKEYSIDKKTAGGISVEGVTKGWPMP